MSDLINIAERERLMKEAEDLQHYCREHRSENHRCVCPFSVSGVCCMHYSNHPDGWMLPIREKN